MPWDVGSLLTSSDQQESPEGRPLFKTMGWVQKARIWASACHHWVPVHRKGVDTSSPSVLLILILFLLFQYKSPPKQR